MEIVSALVLHRKTAYTKMTEGPEKSRLEHLKEQKDPILERILTAHGNHEKSLEMIESELRRMSIRATWRHELSGIIPDDFDLVITVGGDGTVLHASHSIETVPILSINSSPLTSMGYFSAGNADSFPQLLEKIQDGTMSICKLYRMEAKVNGEVVNSRILNDVLFSNVCPASTTRYELRLDERAESHVSSGMWISTAAGSTAAVRAAGGSKMDISSDEIQFAVREPCPGGGKGKFTLPDITNSTVSSKTAFAIRSKSNNARLFIDGPHVVVPVNFGDIITFSGGAPPISVFGNLG